MPANTWAGEVAIIDAREGREYVFRPSFLALSKLSNDPREILQYADAIGKNDGLIYAYEVLDACYIGNNDLTAMIGHYDENGRHIAGRCARECVHELGIRLLINGMCGRPRKQTGKKLTEWNPAVYVGHAMAHLGLSRADSWELTMMELQAALEAKFPPPEEEKPAISEAQWAFYNKALEQEKLKHG